MFKIQLSGTVVKVLPEQGRLFDNRLRRVVNYRYMALLQSIILTVLALFWTEAAVFFCLSRVYGF
jgi:hypothetical protein